MANISRGTEGRRRYIRQQAVESPPYTNCRVVVAAMQLTFAGLSISDVRKFVSAVRHATGVPEVSDSGRSQGTSAADLILGLSKVVPWVDVEFRAMGWDDLFDSLRAGDLTASVSVGYADAKGRWILPARLRASSPSFKGRHQFWLADARVHGGARQVLWVNCLDRVAAMGQWLSLDSVREYAVRSGSGTSSVAYVTTIGRSDGMKDSLITDRVFPVPATVEIPAGADVFEYDPTRNDLVRAKKTTKKVIAKADCTERARKVPPGPPSGPMVRLVSPASMAGQRVRATQVVIKEAPASDCAAQVEAAVAPLRQDVAERDAYIAAVRAIPVPDAAQ